jgi:hypothetical protein
MATDPVIRVITRHWDSVVAHLTNAQKRQFLALVGRVVAPGVSADDRFDATEDLVHLLSYTLPANHPVRRAIAADFDRSQLVAGADQAIIEELRLLLEPQMRQLFGPESAASQASATWGIRPPGGPLPAEVERLAMDRLLAAPALSAAELRRRGGDPGQRYLIRLDGRDGPRYPVFQFDAASRPLPVVLRINALLDADLDPWGVADWWLGPSAWLDRTPAESIGRVADEQLLGMARGVAEGE